MKRSTAILKVRDIMSVYRKGICDSKTASYAILHISMASGVDSGTLIESATILLQYDFNLNKAS